MSVISIMTSLKFLKLEKNRIKDFSPLWNLGLRDEDSELDGQLGLLVGQFRKVEGAEPFRCFDRYQV